MIWCTYCQGCLSFKLLTVQRMTLNFSVKSKQKLENQRDIKILNMISNKCLHCISLSTLCLLSPWYYLQLFLLLHLASPCTLSTLHWSSINNNNQWSSLLPPPEHCVQMIGASFDCFSQLNMYKLMNCIQHPFNQVLALLQFIVSLFYSIALQASDDRIINIVVHLPSKQIMIWNMFLTRNNFLGNCLPRDLARCISQCWQSSLSSLLAAPCLSLVSSETSSEASLVIEVNPLVRLLRPSVPHQQELEEAGVAEETLPTSSSRAGTTCSAGDWAALTSPRARDWPSADPMVWEQSVWTLLPRRLSSRGWWSGRVRWAPHDIVNQQLWLVKLVF